jgi:hypothetical protein
MAGPLTAQQVTLGDSATDSQNFRLRSNADGTLTLARGANGALGSVLTVDSAGRVATPQGPAARTDTVSMVRLNTANGYGSTNTVIRRFTNVVTNQGTDITYADSATLGASFTINTAGVYSISHTDFQTNGFVGISLNTTQPTTNIQALSNPSEVLAAVFTAITNGAGCPSWTGFLPAGSVVRPHNNGVANSGGATQFTITRVS